MFKIKNTYFRHTMWFFSVLRNNIGDFLGIFIKDSQIISKKQMKILIFNWRDTKHRWAGGAEVYIQEIAKQWVKTGKDVTIFCGHDGYSKRHETVDGVQIIRRGGFYTVYFWAFIYYLLKLRRKYDIIIDAENGIPFLTPLFSRKPIFLLVHHVHQEIFRAHLSKPLATIALFIETKVMPFVYKNKPIIAVSKSTKQEIIHLGFSEKNLMIINPGITTNNFSKTKKTKDPTFIYLGRLQRYKNIDILITAFAKIVSQYPTAKLLIAGTGESIDNIKTIIQQLKLEKHVSLLGRVSEQEKVNLFGSSWMAIQPSQIEGWGITVIEANACGTPVIASNVNGLKDSIISNKTGLLVDVKNFDQLAAAMIKLTKNKNLREKLSAEAYHWAQTFNWDNSAAMFMQKIETELSLHKKVTYNKHYRVSISQGNH